MDYLVKPIKSFVRRGVNRIAVWVNRVSRGRITPDSVTLFGAAMHVPIALAIAFDRPYWAAGLLVVFGLFDALDGSLARLQERASTSGMLLDASTDRVKEAVLYSGVAYLFVEQGQPAWAVASVTLALGASIIVSYVKAKGEAAIASVGHVIPHAKLNRMFADGWFPFEVRMSLLVIGLVSGWLLAAVIVIAVGASVTIVQRMILINRALRS